LTIKISSKKGERTMSKHDDYIDEINLCNRPSWTFPYWKAAYTTQYCVNENKNKEKDMLQSLMKKFQPTRVIFNPPATVCFFPDGDKVVVSALPMNLLLKNMGSWPVLSANCMVAIALPL
jgi:hypothetical protein